MFANGSRVENIAKARELLGVPQASCDADSPDNAGTDNAEDPADAQTCPSCGGRMIVIETFEPGCMPRTHPPPEGIDSS